MTTQRDYLDSITASLQRICVATGNLDTLRAIDQYVALHAETEADLAKDKGKPRILTSFEYPPIPFRGHDWLAWYEGEEDYDMHTGSGPTEADAIADLLENHDPIN